MSALVGPFSCPSANEAHLPGAVGRTLGLIVSVGQGEILLTFLHPLSRRLVVLRHKLLLHYLDLLHQFGDKLLIPMIDVLQLGK